MKLLGILLLVGTSALSQAQTTLLNGLQACYPFNLSAANSATTGAALNGTLNNVAPVTGHSGQPNTAYSLNGSTSSYIELPDHPGLKNNSVFFTGWFFLDSLPNEQYLVFTKNSCFYNFEAYSLITYYDASLSRQVFRVSKSDNSCTYAPQVQSTTTPTTGTWYHIGFFIDNAVIKLYVNGSLEASTAHSTLFDYQAFKTVFLGVTNESNFNLPFKGRIDNARFYNRELTAAEVLSLYNQDGPCAAEVTTSLSESGTEKPQVKVYPNPSTGKIHLEGLYKGSVTIYDLSGKAVSYTSKPVNASGVDLELVNAPDGVYLINVTNEAGLMIQTSKIVIAR